MNEPEENPEKPEDLAKTVVVESRPKPYFEMLQEDPAQLRVEVLGGPMDGLRSRVTADTLALGRAQDSDLVLPLDRGISAHHARIVQENLEYWIEDLDSRNGTYLGEKKVLRRAPIRPGTVFMLGSTCIEFMPR